MGLPCMMLTSLLAGTLAGLETSRPDELRVGNSARPDSPVQSDIITKTSEC